MAWHPPRHTRGLYRRRSRQQQAHHPLRNLRLPLHRPQQHLILAALLLALSTLAPAQQGGTVPTALTIYNQDFAVARTTILMKASLANAQDLIPLLLKAGAHYPGTHEEMMAAAAHGDAIRIRELVAAGAEVNFDAGQGRTPLMAAALGGHTVAVRALLAAGANPKAIANGNRTALYDAIRSAHRSTVDELLAAGTDPTLVNGGGGTSIMDLANFMDDPDLLQRFIAAGVDPNAITTNGSRYNALMQAATMGHTQVLKALLAVPGAQVNLQAVLEGDTALIEAARSGQIGCVELLLAAGADPTLRDHRSQPGKTAYDWAIEFSHPEVAALLKP